MRKLSIAILVLVLILVGVVVIAAMNLNAYLEANREMLAGLASDAAGREVEFERAEVAFSEGLAVRVVGLRVGEDPRFGKADFLAMDEAFVRVQILPALSGRIDVSGVRLDSPTIRIIRTARGFNFSSLGASGDAPPPESTEEDSAPMALGIAALEIVEGTISYDDRRSADGLSLVVEDFTSSGTDLSRTGPLEIDFAGRVRSTKPEDKGLVSEVEGEVDLAGLDPLSGDVTLRSPSLHPALFGFRFEEADGAVERLDRLVIDIDIPPDSEKRGYPVTIRSSEARLAGFDLEDVAIDANYRDTRRGSAVKLDRASVGLAGGRVELAGNVLLGEPGASPFDLKTTVREIDSGQLAAALLGVPAGVLTGTLGGDATFRGDSLEWDSLKRSLAGNLRLEVGEGALEQVNVLNTIVGRLTTDPGLGRLAAASIRETIPEALSGDRTPFQGIDMALEILNGAVQAKDLSIAARDFGIQAAGRVGLDGSVAADGTFRFSEALSKKILAKADRLAPLLAQGDVVALPLRFGGTASSPKIMPDLAALTSRAQGELGGRAARELSDRIFGTPKEGEDADPEREAQRGAAEDLLKEGLGRILGR